MSVRVLSTGSAARRSVIKEVKINKTDTEQGILKYLNVGLFIYGLCYDNI